MAEAPQLQPNTDLAVADTGNQDPVNDRLNFKLNPNLTVSNLRQQYNIQTPAEQEAAQPPDKRGFLRKAVDFIGEPINNLIVRDIGGIMRANDVSKASNQAETQAIQLIQESKNKYNQGIITKDQFNQRLQHIRDMGVINLGDELPTGKQVVGDIIGSALTVAPVWEIKALKGLPLLQKLVRGGIYGAGFMGSQAASENKSAESIIKNAGVGFLFGGPMEILGGYGLKLLGSLGRKTLTTAASKVATPLMEKAGSLLEKAKPSALFDSVINRLRTDFGEHGAQIANTFEHASLQTKTQIGQAIDKLNKVGFFGMTDEAAWKNPNSLLNQLQGKWQAGKEGVFKVADQMRKEINAMATDVLPQYRGMANYYPHYIHEPNYLKGGKIREDILQNAVLNEGFPDIQGAGAALDDFIQIMEKGNTIQNKNTNKWIQYMLDKGYAKNADEALGKTVKYFGSNMNPGRGSSQFLEHARDFNVPFYDPNPTRVLPLYAMDAYRNLNLAHGFGADNEILNTLIGKAVDQGPNVNPQDLNKLVNILFNHIDKSTTPLERGAAWLRSMNQIKLTFSAFINATQSLNPLMVSDYGSFFKGLRTALTDKGTFLENGLKTGASVEYFIRNELLKKGYTPTFADWYLRSIGMGVTERFNRNLAANVGINYVRKIADEAGLVTDKAMQSKIETLMASHTAEKTQLGTIMNDIKKARVAAKLDPLEQDALRAEAQKQLLQANPEAGAYQKFLQSQEKIKGDLTAIPKSKQANLDDELRMLLGSDEALKEAKLRGFLSEEDMLHAGQVMSEMTQFNSDPHYLPEWASSTLGKLEFQFKNFGYRQATFMKDRITQLATRGEYGKIAKILLTLATIFPMSAEVALDARSVVTGQKRPTWKNDPLGRYLEDLTSAGGFGLMTDLIKNASYGKLLETIAGPSASTLGDLGNSLVGASSDVLHGEFGAAGKKVKNSLKGLLPPLKPILNRITPPKGKGKDFLHEIFSEITNPLGFPTALASMAPENMQPGNKPTRTNSLAALTPLGFTDDNGNLITPAESEVGKNIIAGVDISKYATDPKHEAKVKAMYDQIGELKTVGDIENHIRAKAPGSPITGAMVAKASAKYDIDPKLLIAIMRQDSSLGTKGLGARTRNPGNVGNNDRGQVVKYKSWQEGVDAVARFLTKYKV